MAAAARAGRAHRRSGGDLKTQQAALVATDDEVHPGPRVVRAVVASRAHVGAGAGALRPYQWLCAEGRVEGSLEAHSMILLQS